jgi:alcohol dehydrogenase (cytochrome c)
LYDQTCQSCHGPAGQGDRGPALNQTNFARGSSDGDLFRAIRAGAPGTQMPAFAQLTDTQTWQLVSYVRSLAAAAPARPAAPPPVTVVVRTKDGRELRGTRLNEDTFSVQFVDASGAWYFFDKLTRNAHRVDPGGVTSDRLEKARAEPQNWLMYWGDYASTHYSGLKQIDAANVASLRAAWTFPMPGDSVLEATPVVADGVMNMTQPGGRRGARRAHGPPALAVRTAAEGEEPLRDQPVQSRRGRRRTAAFCRHARCRADRARCVVKDKVLVGITGGEFGARGFLDAYDTATGRRLWRWYAVPAPGEFGNDTWKGDSRTLGGSPTWLTGSYDPELNLVYWTVGNPGPQIDRSTRGDLDNVFSDSVVAIDADTGQRKWHYQVTPNDGHDWDSCQAVVLVDRAWHGQMRKLLLQADRNGLFYVPDRANGTFLSATPFV